IAFQFERQLVNFGCFFFFGGQLCGRRFQRGDRPLRLKRRSSLPVAFIEQVAKPDFGFFPGAVGRHIVKIRVEIPDDDSQKQKKKKENHSDGAYEVFKPAAHAVAKCAAPRKFSSARHKLEKNRRENQQEKSISEYPDFFIKTLPAYERPAGSSQQENEQK